MLEIHGAEMVVAGQQDGAAQGGSLGEDLGIIGFGGREQTCSEQTPGDLLDVRVAKRDGVNEFNAPSAVPTEERLCCLSFVGFFGLTCQPREFFGNRRWNQQRATWQSALDGRHRIHDPLVALGQVHADVCVSGE
jgi:hypothetical protein